MDARVNDFNTLLSRIMVDINAEAFHRLGDRVLGGPFAGMKIPRFSPWEDGNSGVKLLGLYERELYPAFQHIAWRQPRVFVNVGCSEGYYAIGFARMLPNLVVRGFDLNSSCLGLCEEFAEENKVAARVRLIEGTKNAADLRLRDLGGHRFYLFDCEGHELDLVNLETVPELLRSDLIIECHDFMRPDTSLILSDRLSQSHYVELIRPQLPDLHNTYFLNSGIETMLLVTEKRPGPCYWLVCWANRRGD